MAGAEIDNQDVALRFAVAGLVLSGATNAVVGVLDAVEWAWWVTGACLLVALLAAGVWSGPNGERAARRRSGRMQQVHLVVGEVEPAALVRGHPWVSAHRLGLVPSAGDTSARSTAVAITPGAIVGGRSDN